MILYLYRNKDGRVTMIGGGNLQILNVKSATPTDLDTDEAMYMCRAENDIDSVDAEAKLTVLGIGFILYKKNVC